MKDKLVHISIISIFVSLYFLVATISMINSVAFFDLSHSGLMSWSLAIGFELGAAASLAAIIILDKTNKTMVWGLFLLLTAFQMMANSFHAFINSANVTEGINNQPVKDLVEVIEELPNNIENTEDDVLPTIDESRVSKTKVHHVEKISKNDSDSSIAVSNFKRAKHNNPKP